MNVLALIFSLLYLCLAHCMPWCSYLGGSGEKSPSKDMKKEEKKKKKNPTFKFVTTSFFAGKPNQLGLGNCSATNFCKTRYFCS